MPPVDAPSELLIPAAVADRDLPADPACPKCGVVAPRGAAACPACGLAVARMAAYRDARDAAVPEPVREAWTRTTEHWDDPAQHDELLRLVVTNNVYAWAAGRYRTRGGDPIAQRQLERLRRAAEITMFASATVRPEAKRASYRSLTSVLVVLIIVIAAGLLYAMVIHVSGRARRPPAAQSSDDRSPPPGPAQPLQPGHPVSSSTIR